MKKILLVLVLIIFGVNSFSQEYQYPYKSVSLCNKSIIFKINDNIAVKNGTHLFKLMKIEYDEDYEIVCTAVNRELNDTLIFYASDVCNGTIYKSVNINSYDNKVYTYVGESPSSLFYKSAQLKATGLSISLIGGAIGGVLAGSGFGTWNYGLGISGAVISGVSSIVGLILFGVSIKTEKEAANQLSNISFKIDGIRIDF